jgi:hypothetical protein
VATRDGKYHALLNFRPTFGRAPRSGPPNSRRAFDAKLPFGCGQLPDTLSTVNSPDWPERPTWPDRPTTAHFGPAAWQSSLLALLSAMFVRPVLGALTILGMIVTRFRPEAMQRARLDVIDKPLRVIPPLPGTEVTPVALPHCTAEWVVQDEVSA